MPKVLVATSPAHDLATEYVDIWLEKALAKFRNQPDLQIIELKGVEANRAALEAMISEHRPKLVLLNGHGDAKSMDGFQDNVLVRCDDNEAILSGSIAHMLACETAAELGPKCIRAGGLAYLGYQLPFEMRLDQNATDRSAKAADCFAALTLDPAFAAIEALIAGNTVEAAHRHSQEAHRQVLQGLIAAGNDQAKALGQHVWHNMQCQTVLGDGTAAF